MPSATKPTVPSKNFFIIILQFPEASQFLEAVFFRRYRREPIQFLKAP
jgi:hypothetical protein